MIEPEFEEIFARDPDAIRTKLGAPTEGGDGGGRNAGMGGLLAHPLWPQLEPLLHAPWHSDDLLDFLERLFGPFVQLDGFGITGTPPHAYTAARRGTLVDQGWHRDSSIADRYGQHGAGTPYEGLINSYATPKYKPPNGVNLLTYLQDMDETTGALRVVRRSHLGQPPTPSGEAKGIPHPEEILLDMKAGDLVVMHGECIHAGTQPHHSPPSFLQFSLSALSSIWPSCTHTHTDSALTSRAHTFTFTLLSTVRMMSAQPTLPCPAPPSLTRYMQHLRCFEGVCEHLRDPGWLPTPR